MLADLGAEVIKVEAPEVGDPGRRVGALSAGSTPKQVPNFFFECNNRHKRSITVDVRKPEGREIVCRLAEKSDVFVQNFRVGVAQRLGLDYAALSARNPRLIYASGSGYGPEGPDRGEPSFDYLAQARSGIMQTVGGPDTPPSYIVAGIADEAGAIMLAFGIVTALVARDRYGIGQEVDTSLLGSMTSLQRFNVSARAMVGREIARAPREQVFNPLWNHYRCKDGKWICFGMPESDRYWKDFCAALQLDGLAGDPRFADLRARGKNAAELIAILDRTFATRPRHEWLPILGSVGDLIYTVVNSISDLPGDPQVIANEYIVDYEHPEFGKLKLLGLPIRFHQTPGDPRGHAPKLGQDTDAVLGELLGYSREEIVRFHETGLI
jgi:crotonobetainyl-CoA:carnitine CoA-transferase CaiB-like acyl-CoA transferase